MRVIVHQGEETAGKTNCFGKEKTWGQLKIFYVVTSQTGATAVVVAGTMIVVVVVVVTKKATSKWQHPHPALEKASFLLLCRGLTSSALWSPRNDLLLRSATLLRRAEE